MKKRKNSGLLLAARMAAGRAARRIGARVAVAGKRVARKYGKRLATYGVNELESRGQKLLETASGSARQRIARMNPGLVWEEKNKRVFVSVPFGYKVIRLKSGWRAWKWDTQDSSWRDVKGAESLQTPSLLKKLCERDAMRSNPSRQKGLESVRMNPNKVYRIDFFGEGPIGEDTAQYNREMLPSYVVESPKGRVFESDESGVPRAWLEGASSAKAYAATKENMINSSLRAAGHGERNRVIVTATRVTNAKRKNPCADVSWPPHKSYQLVSRVPVYIPRSNPIGKVTDKRNPLSPYAKMQRKAERAAGITPTPRPKFKVGDRVADKEDGERAGEVVAIGNYDDYIKGHIYKVQQDNGGARHWRNGPNLKKLRTSRKNPLDGTYNAARQYLIIASQTKINPRRNPKFPIKAVYDGGGGVGLIPVSVIGLRPKRYDYESDHYDVVSNSKTSKVFPKGYKFVASKTDLVSPDAIRRRKYGTYIVAHKHVLDR